MPLLETCATCASRTQNCVFMAEECPDFRPMVRMYVIHLNCERRDHFLPLGCACYAVSAENAQLAWMCQEKGRIKALAEGETARWVTFRCSGTIGHYNVTRLSDQDPRLESPNARS